MLRLQHCYHLCNLSVYEWQTVCFSCLLFGCLYLAAVTWPWFLLFFFLRSTFLLPFKGSHQFVKDRLKIKWLLSFWFGLTESTYIVLFCNQFWIIVFFCVQYIVTHFVLEILNIFNIREQQNKETENILSDNHQKVPFMDDIRRLCFFRGK